MIKCPLNSYSDSLPKRSNSCFPPNEPTEPKEPTELKVPKVLNPQYLEHRASDSQWFHGHEVLDSVENDREIESGDPVLLHDRGRDCDYD